MVDDAKGGNNVTPTADSLPEHPGWTYCRVTFWPDSAACEGWAWDGPDGERVASLGDWQDEPEWPFDNEGNLLEGWTVWND